MPDSSKTFSKLANPLLVLLTICFFALPTQGEYGGGTGEPNDPYLIYDANQMNAIGADSNDWDKCFKLMADIDLAGFSGASFNIIGELYYDSGWIENPFTGVFDGNGHTISNFTYDSNDRDYTGLFGHVGNWGENAEIKNLGLIEPNVEAGTGDVVGSLVGDLINGTITNCYVEGGSVAGDSYVGGLLGYNGSGTITNFYATGSVSGERFVGGLVGQNEGTITNCYSTGSVSGNDDIGGLVGYNYSDGTITNCYAAGGVTGLGGWIGGLVGFNDGDEVWASFWDIQTSGQRTSYGGTGKTTAQMQMKVTFTDAAWDFVEIWDICEGTNYPRFIRQIPAGDFLCPDGVDMRDFAILAAQWLQSPGDPSADIAPDGGDGMVDRFDLAALADNWLAGF